MKAQQMIYVPLLVNVNYSFLLWQPKFLTGSLRQIFRRI
jgi:hypothetical protein